tara:strand:- start:2128 stop:2502 length:375 start_codon:yes stop_codon:yes gene_type:complete
MSFDEEILIRTLVNLDDFVELLTMSYFRKKNGDYEKIKFFLSYIAFFAIIWNVSLEVLKNKSVLAGILKGMIMLLSGYILMNNFMPYIVSSQKSVRAKFLAGAIAITLSEILEELLWNSLEGLI